MLSGMECRANSTECGRKAREEATLPISTLLANMALTWKTLAGQMDRLEDLLKAHRPPAR